MKKIKMQKNTNITIEKGFEEFIRNCKVRNLSQSSIKTYCSHYKIFIDFMGKKGDMYVKDITPMTWVDYIEWLQNNRSCSDITKNSYLRTVRAFFYYLMEVDYIEEFKVKMMKTDNKIKEAYTDSELRILLEKPDIKKCTFNEFRIWALSNYLLATGNRISTVLNIKIRELDLDDGFIKMSKMKNRKEQIIPISNQLAEVMKEYLRFRGGQPDDYLFPTVYGKKASVRTYENALKIYNANRGIETSGLHRYRNTFAKHWILNGGDVFRLQKLLGHSSLEMVKKYVEMYSQDLVRDFERFNPLDNLIETKTNTKAIRMRKHN